MRPIIGTVINIADFLSIKEQNISQENGNPYYLAGNRTYIIPDFQREIRWDAEHIIELINNIGDGSKFLGNIILSERVRKNIEKDSRLKDYEIIDGQQRITVLLMIIKFIEYKYGEDLYINTDYCDLEMESLKAFPVLYENAFQESIALSDSIRETDDLNQIPHYLYLWNTICKYSIDSASRLRNKDSCQKWLENLRNSTLNVIINTSDDDSQGIKFFLDVNLKGKKLDTEDVFKSYLFYYDSSREIRELWVRLKKLSSKLTVHTERKEKNPYPLMEIIRHSFYCYLYKEKYWKSIDISNNFCLLKNSIILGNNESENSLHYRGEHIIDAIKSRKLMKIILESVEDFLVMAVDVVNTKLPSAKFEEYFNVSQGKNVDSVTIIIAHSFIRRILCDETILPKAILFKYFISTLSNKQSIKEDYKWIFDVYAFNILFNLSAIKKQKDIILNIVSEKREDSDWHTELSLAIQEFLKEDKLSRTKVVLQYKFINEESNEEYLSRGLAVLYNFYKIKNGKCSVSNERNLKNFLTNSSNYSLEHFIINKSKKYDIGTKKPFPIQGETGKCVNSMFNFIFIPETLNKDLGNKIIYEKVDILEKRKCDIQCEFSRKVIELVFFASTFSSKMQIEFLKVAWGISPVLHFLRRHSFRCRRGAVAGIQSLLVTDM